MVAISSIIAAASVAAGIGSAAKASSDARKARKAQAAALAQQKLEAKEAAALSLKREDTGADVIVGTDNETANVAADTVSAEDKKKSRSATPLGGVKASRTVGL